MLKEIVALKVVRVVKVEKTHLEQVNLRSK
jgi:hypothetical protein